MKKVHEGTFKYFYPWRTQAKKVRLGTPPYGEYHMYLPVPDAQAVPRKELIGPTQPPQRTNILPKTAAPLKVLKALVSHAALTWCKPKRRGHRLVHFGLKGSVNVRSPLKGDYLLVVKVESATAKPSQSPSIFSMPVPTAGALDLVARDLGDVLRELTVAQTPASNGTPSGYPMATVERTEHKKATLKGRP